MYRSYGLAAAKIENQRGLLSFIARVKPSEKRPVLQKQEAKGMLKNCYL